MDEHDELRVRILELRTRIHALETRTRTKREVKQTSETPDEPNPNPIQKLGRTEIFILLAILSVGSLLLVCYILWIRPDADAWNLFIAEAVFLALANGATGIGKLIEFFLGLAKKKQDSA